MTGRAKRGDSRPNPSTAVADHPVRPGSVLYQILEAVASRVAKRLRDGRHHTSSEEESHDNPTGGEAGGNA